MIEYIKARLNSAALKESYREYITDAFFYQGQGKTHAKRWAELVRPAVPQKNPEEVLSEVLAKTGLVI